MPALPELGQAGGDVGHVEVAVQVEAQHPRRADGHVGVAGEVAVDLNGVGEDGQPDGGGGEVVGLVEHLIDEGGHRVGQQQLLDQADGEDLRPVPHVLGAHADGLLQLRQEVGRAHDGAGDEAREEGYKQAVVHQAIGRLERAAIDVNGVADGLEGEEGDANGQNDAERAQVDAQRSQQRLGRGDEEVEVLEEAQNAQVQHQRGDQDALLAGLVGGRVHGLAQVGVGHGREDEQGQEAVVPVGVEVVAGDQQDDLARPLAGHDDQQGHDGQQEQEELEAGEDHCCTSAMAPLCCR